MEVKHRGGASTEENYKGIPIHAAKGVHATVADIIEAKLGLGGTVADVGAGDGALSLRLHDKGYKVVAFDFNNATWKIDNVPCHNLDVEKNVRGIFDKGPYKAICAIEIIEHLENPREFLRQLIEEARKNNSIIILSTPNPLDTFSSISMFTRGIFNWFGPEAYSGGGHISILPHWMIIEHLRFLGVDKFDCRFCAPYHHPSSIKRMVYNMIRGLRVLVSKAEDKSFFDGQTALITVYPD